MNYTLSDIYKNFDYENNKIKSIEEMEVTNYKGIQCGQVTGFHHLLNILFLKQSFKNVIELGTQRGGTSLFLNDLTNLYGGKNFITFDIDKCNTNIKLNQVVGDVLNDENIVDLIKTNIQKEGKTLLFCDGGDKKAEFNKFSPFLKNGDFIMLHDYAHNKRFFDEEIHGKVWFWHEAQFSDIKESVEKYNLISYNKAQMSAFVYGCFFKKG
jgi:cephalosporin hydroxylase